ncbi:fused FliR family export protein/FlhB family type III secretion system protein [Clostridium sp. CCUG 7971]|uniref:fused FliR family export protein/FlhB family type III secretion system protein n=1 Tax=Clostridium sp. CCUG 7971 TaxID=2811414 RepID=UPI001ABB334D|nr:fused FliR family export protein/FlhB family type III secretion system protein [Clostridium sp. CCUG 7971]MBO3445080.1 fused FliR family export protein/FlhB family type III secretion system protein [Clostridium sp. CCUG 7971]
MILIFIRLITFFSSINVIFPSGTPNIFKVGFSLFVSVVISFTINIDVNIASTVDLINYSAMETVTGLVLGFITSICFSSLKVGGSLIDQQLGLSMVNIYDPNSKDQSTLVENILYWMGIIIFFSMNGHHMLIEGIQKSFKLVPLGQSILSNNFTYVINVFIEYFIIGFKIAVPIILSLIIADLIMGLISRSVPQLNVMVIGMPLKILVGIMFFIIALPFILSQVHNLFNKIPDVLDGTLALKNSFIGPMAVMLSTGDKTEEPTAKKKKDARKKGNIAKSREVPTAFTLVGILLIVYIMSDYIILEIKKSLAAFLSMDFGANMDFNMLKVLFTNLGMTFMKVFLPIGLVIIVFGVVGHIMQSGLLFTGETLKPKLSKLNPINGFKNMFSAKALGNMIKSIAIIVVLFIIGYSFMTKNFEGIMKIGDVYLPYLMPSTMELIKQLLKDICLAVIVISVFDFVYQKYTHKKDLKMTKQEVKEEYKQIEGNPQLKSKIKQKQREMSAQRMMQAVPSSTVIVTNPTHISIAIRYEKGKDTTPIIVAKGADVIAFKIREIAKEHDIPIIENKPLARLIYKEIEVNQEIPEGMYQEVAEVLVAVYKIKNRYKKL